MEKYGHIILIFFILISIAIYAIETLSHKKIK